MHPQHSDRPSLYDQHTIETPEQMSLNLALAGIGSRFLAIAIDTLAQILIMAGVLVVLFLIGLTGTLRGVDGQSVWVLGTVIAVAFLIFYGYFAIFEILWNGQTPGKRAVGIRVVKDSGRPLSAAETIGRNLMRIVDQLPALYMVGIVTAMLNSKNRRLGDFVAGSIIVRERSLADFKLDHVQSQSATGSLAAPVGLASLSMEDLRLIEAFLNRRHSLENDIRSRAAAQILARIKSTSPSLSIFGAEQGQSDEAMLEALAHERRSLGQ
jgi:uncharacterized RDD family membrane protein YckC